MPGMVASAPVHYVSSEESRWLAKMFAAQEICAAVLRTHISAVGYATANTYRETVLTQGMKCTVLVHKIKVKCVTVYE